jgi:hypothetical protein
MVIVIGGLFVFLITTGISFAILRLLIKKDKAETCLNNYKDSL